MRYRCHSTHSPMSGFKACFNCSISDSVFSGSLAASLASGINHFFNPVSSTVLGSVESTSAAPTSAAGGTITTWKLHDPLRTCTRTSGWRYCVRIILSTNATIIPSRRPATPLPVYTVASFDVAQISCHRPVHCVTTTDEIQKD